MTFTSEMLDPNMPDDKIYEILYSRLKLYTGLWFATVNNESWNLQYTAILIEIYRSKHLMDLVCLSHKYVKS